MAVTNEDVVALLTNATFRAQCTGGIIRIARVIVDNEPADTQRYALALRAVQNAGLWGEFCAWLCSNETILAKADDPSKISDELVDIAINESWPIVANGGVPPDGK